MKKNGIPSWVTDFFDRLHLPEQKKVAKRLSEHPKIDEVFAEIDGQFSIKPSGKAEILRVIPEIDENPDKRIGREHVLAAIIDGAVFCSPKRLTIDSKGTPSPNFLSTKEIREEYKEAQKLQKEIAETSSDLISLIERYESIKEKGFVDSDADIDLFHLINRAAQTMLPTQRQYSYEHYIAPHIEKAEDASNCNCDYYPSLQEILDVLSLEMVGNKVVLSRSFVDWKRVLRTQQASPSEFIRFFLLSIEGHKPFRVPRDFNLKNSTLAAIAACVLDSNEGMQDDNIRKIKKKLTAENF
jgi:hypothetical protein